MIFSDKLQTVAINISSSGDNTIIAAPGDGKYLVIDHVNILPTSVVSVTFKQGSTSVSGPYPLDAKQAITLENVMGHQDGIITCGNNAAFVINLGGAVQVGGMVRYRIINN